jgi:hypothetical protein
MRVGSTEKALSLVWQRPRTAGGFGSVSLRPRAKSSYLQRLARSSLKDAEGLEMGPRTGFLKCRGGKTHSLWLSVCVDTLAQRGSDLNGFERPFTRLRESHRLNKTTKAAPALHSRWW